MQNRYPNLFETMEDDIEGTRHILLSHYLFLGVLEIVLVFVSSHHSGTNNPNREIM